MTPPKTTFWFLIVTLDSHWKGGGVKMKKKNSAKVTTLNTNIIYSGIRNSWGGVFLTPRMGVVFWSILTPPFCSQKYLVFGTPFRHLFFDCFFASFSDHFLTPHFDLFFWLQKSIEIDQKIKIFFYHFFFIFDLFWKFIKKYFHCKNCFYNLLSSQFWF